MTLRLWISSLMLAAGVAIGLASPAPAQEIRGVVRHADTGTPVSLALVLMLDGDGEVLARALSDDSGRFRIRGPTPDRGASIRVERIGLGAVTVDLATVARDGEIELVLSNVPVRIDGIVAEAVDRCPAHPNDERLAAAWSEFRPLLASLERVEIDPTSRFEVLYSEAELDSNGGDVALTLVDTLLIAEAVPFRTEDPAVLTGRGFVVEDSDSTVSYYAPDARVLLSSEFIGTHCYRLPELQTRPGYLVIEFGPRDRDAERDIGGVFALPVDGESLPRIEFYFTSHPWGYRPDPRLGGFVELAPTEFGWVVSDWELRVPGPPMVEIGRVPPIASMTGYRGRLMRILVGRE